jgi:hypothetical protein
LSHRSLYTVRKKANADMTDEANLNLLQPEDPPEEISPALDAAMRELKELFSDPAVASQARLSCSTEGPTEFDVMFESILDDQFGYDPNSEYKNWVRSLYDLGLIPRIPSEWEAPATPEGKSPA